MLADVRALQIDIAIYEGFPEQWADERYDEWYELDEEISFVDYLYRVEASRTND